MQLKSWIILLIGIGLSKGIAQIPINADSVIQVKIDSAARIHPYPVLNFFAEIDGARMKNRRHRFGFIEPNGARRFIKYNRRKNKWIIPKVEAEFVKLFYINKKDTIVIPKIPRFIIMRGGGFYFGKVEDFHEIVSKCDSDAEFEQRLFTDCRGLSQFLHDEKIESDAEKNIPLSMYYTAIEWKGTISYSYYFK